MSSDALVKRFPREHVNCLLWCCFDSCKHLECSLNLYSVYRAVKMLFYSFGAVSHVQLVPQASTFLRTSSALTLNGHFWYAGTQRHCGFVYRLLTQRLVNAFAAWFAADFVFFLLPGAFSDFKLKSGCIFCICHWWACLKALWTLTVVQACSYNLTLHQWQKKIIIRQHWENNVKMWLTNSVLHGKG